MSEFKNNNSTEFRFASNLAQGFTVVPNPVMNDMPRMGADAFAILIKLFQYANADGHKTTVRGLAKLTGVSINRTSKAINKLIEIGYIVRTPKYVGNLIHGYIYEVYDKPVEITRCHEGCDNGNSDTELRDNKKENGLKNKDFKKENKDVDDAAEKIIALYKSFKIEKRVMPHTLRLLRENAHKFSEEVWEYIFIQASEDSVAKKYNYIKELVADFTKNKIHSLEDLERYNAKYKESKSKPKEKKLKTRFHNINQRTDKYTEEELNEILAASQKAKYGKEQDKPVKPAVFVVTEEIYQDALRRNWNEYDLNQKIKLRQYAMFNNKFIPSSWVLTE